ncbi:glycosyltransferase [Candidatus Pacearchaeota archaeon]|nr:glycosyltransferase [Candidatus Pacearchaeota archaeon]
MNEYMEMCSEMGVPGCEFLQPKIAFIYYDFSSFVKQDYEILSKHFAVEKVSYRRPKDILKIARAIFNSDLTYSWFASGHAFAACVFSKLFGKKSIVVAGGYDVSYMPEVNYGLYCGSRIRRFMTDYVLRNADKILAVSEFTAREALNKQPTAKINIIYNAVDTTKVHAKGEKQNLVITVGTNIQRKRLDIFIETAGILPNIRFAIVGLRDCDIEHLRQDKPQNLELHGKVPDILSYYRAAKVYCQLSFHEGFGVAMAEAMACECVPVVTRCGAMPEVVGDTGAYVPYGSAKATADGIVTAMYMNGTAARKRIVENFSIRRREKKLLEVIND